MGKKKPLPLREAVFAVKLFAHDSLEEEEGFEPSDGSLRRLISSQVHSTTLPLFQNFCVPKLAFQNFCEFTGVLKAPAGL